MKKNDPEKFKFIFSSMRIKVVNPGVKTFLMMLMILVFLTAICYLLRAWVLSAFALPAGRELVNSCKKIFGRKNGAS